MARDTRGRSAGGQARAIGDQLRNAVAGIVRATALEIDANLKAAPSDGGTPVDTNWARANWVPSIGAPFTGESDTAHDAGVAALLAYRLEDGPAFISNNVDYIELLNRGSSKQAAALFIEACIDSALATMQARYGSRAISLDRFRDAAGSIGAENLASAYSPFGGDD